MRYLLKYSLFESSKDTYQKQMEESEQNYLNFEREIKNEIKDILIDLKDDLFTYEVFFDESDGPLSYDQIYVKIYKTKDEDVFNFNIIKDKLLHISSYLNFNNYYLSRDDSYYRGNTNENWNKRKKVCTKDSLCIKERSLDEMINKDICFISLVYDFISPLDEEDFD